MSDLPVLNRRELLRSAVLLIGGTALGTSFELFADSGAQPRFFDDAQYALLQEVVDIIIPRTDTPGALDAGVPAAFDALMNNWASRERQDQFRALLEQIDVAARERGNTFLEFDRTRRVEVLTAFDQAKASDKVYKKFKELVLTLYYYSEVGAMQELHYVHVPGKWEASVRITPDTRSSVL
jgi:gluconate 2-dehydrogenase gamma chain